jgi:hypothetical protein
VLPEVVPVLVELPVVELPIVELPIVELPLVPELLVPLVCATAAMAATSNRLKKREKSFRCMVAPLVGWLIPVVESDALGERPSVSHLDSSSATSVPGPS